MTYYARDLSWLQFNHRVLQEAADERVPLYERIKFLAIYSSNLDEFFRVRVASLRSFKDLKKSTRKALGIKPKKELKLIHPIVRRQQELFGRIWQRQILPALEKEKVFLIPNEAFDARQQVFAEEYFKENLEDQLKYTWLKSAHSPPFLANKGLYLVVSFAAPNEDLALLTIPSDEMDRFVTLPAGNGGHYITFLDDIIRANLKQLFPDQQVNGAYSIKISRDAELYIDDEYSGNLVEKIKQGLEERSIGLPTRFLYDTRMPKNMLGWLKNRFSLSKYDLVPGARYHNFNDFIEFPDPIAKREWHEKPLPPVIHPGLDATKSIMEAMSRQDFILHFPYQKFDYVPQLIKEAANDPLVDAIKITLYRVAAKSDVTDALLEALKKGKKVVVFIEAKARFDEASNLYWGEKLQEAGGKVLYSYPGIKVHTKLLLIRQVQGQKRKHFAYIGTGNFNEKTAKIYCDHALLTTNPKIADEITQVFDLLERKIIVPKTKHIFISPFSTRKGFEKLVDNEIRNARQGKEAYMILKMNSLEDPEMIKKLYEASRAGVKIRMIVRGICCLVPGVPGLSENIHIISIVDRFLEHARIYIFANAGEEKMYIASADWMTRNLDRRVEVAVPILDTRIFGELRRIVDIQLADNTKARIIDAKQSNTYVKKRKDLPVVRAQIDTYYWAKEKAQKAEKV